MHTNYRLVWKIQQQWPNEWTDVSSLHLMSKQTVVRSSRHVFSSVARFDGFFFSLIIFFLPWFRVYVVRLGQKNIRISITSFRTTVKQKHTFTLSYAIFFSNKIKNTHNSKKCFFWHPHNVVNCKKMRWKRIFITKFSKKFGIHCLHVQIIKNLFQITTILKRSTTKHEANLLKQIHTHHIQEWSKFYSTMLSDLMEQTQTIEVISFRRFADFKILSFYLSENSFILLKPIRDEPDISTIRPLLTYFQFIRCISY